MIPFGFVFSRVPFSGLEDVNYFLCSIWRDKDNSAMICCYNNNHEDLAVSFQRSIVSFGRYLPKPSETIKPFSSLVESARQQGLQTYGGETVDDSKVMKFFFVFLIDPQHKDTKDIADLLVALEMTGDLE